MDLNRFASLQGRLALLFLSVVVPLSGVFADFRNKGDTPSEKKGFYDAVNHDWLAQSAIPADKPGISNFTSVQDSIAENLRKIFEEKVAEPTEDLRKAQALYASYLNTDTRNRAGIEPIEDDLDDIDDLEDHEEVALHFARVFKHGVPAPIVWVVGPDFKNSKAHLLWLVQSGLGLPARAMYLDQDERSKGIVEEYTKYITKLLTLAKINSASELAHEVVALERSIAAIQWTPEESRDVQKAYAVMNVDEVQKVLTHIPVKETIKYLGIPEEARFNGVQLSYLKAFNELFVSTPVETWKKYLKVRVINAYSELLSKDFHDASVEYSKALGLVSGEAAPWKQGVDFVQKSVPMLAGKLYVERYFDNEQRRLIEGLVQEIRASAKEVISGSPILSPPTKERALKKLDMMTFNIGYPDTWRDYSDLEVSDDDLVDNFKNTSSADLDDNYKKVLKPTDRSEWERSPSEVNAFYDPTQNKFVLLAGILHPPFYDPKMGAAARYGGLGFVVGHEIGHAFDDSGSQFDEEGNLNNWWTDEDRKKFNKVKKAYIQQANTFEILPGVHLNGELQIGEILGDATGAKLALTAFNKVIEKEHLDKKSSHQAFFRQLAQVWREKYRPEFARLLIATDPHPAGKFRTDGIVVNMDAFHEAFEIKPGDGMYKKPKERKVIW